MGSLHLSLGPSSWVHEVLLDEYRYRLGSRKISTGAPKTEGIETPRRTGGREKAARACVPTTDAYNLLGSGP
jgi:hypothetical protein